MIYKKNDKFIIKGFYINCPIKFKNKLISMGLFEGQQIIVINKGIFGGPIAIETKFGFFSLRKKDLDFLNLEKIS